jgi:protein FAM50
MNSDNSTQQYHEKERQKIYQASQQRKAKIKQETQLKIGNFRSADDSAEAELKAKTYGLVSLSDFQKLKQQVTHSAKPDAPLIKSKKHAKVQLSFENDDEQEEEESFVKKKKIKKNPDVDTSFLPDKERAQAEEKKREELKKVWLDTQQAIKSNSTTKNNNFFFKINH